MKKFLILLFLLIFLFSCAKHPSNIQGIYHEPQQYSHNTCEELVTMITKIEEDLKPLVEKQNEQAHKDSVSVGMGVLIFPPIMFLAIGDSKEDEIAELQGQRTAMEDVLIMKECPEGINIKQSRNEKRLQKEKEEKEEKERIELYGR